MTKLTGEYGDIATEILEDLHIGIDIGRKTVHATHNFQIKLMAVDQIFMHIEADEYWRFEDLYAFLEEFHIIIVDLHDDLTKLEHGDIHIVRKEKSAEKKGIEWIIKHKKKVEKELEHEKDVEEKIIKKIHKALKDIKKIFLKADHLFLIHEEETTIKEIKIDLEEKEAEIKHLVEKLMQFLFMYEKFFKELLEELN